MMKKNPICFSFTARLASFLLVAFVGLMEVQPVIAASQKVFGADIELHACTYDGSAAPINLSSTSESSDPFTQKVVSEILRFSGLPQNFAIHTSEEVPNVLAAVAITSAEYKRILVCNDRFIQDVSQASAKGNWAPVSILAHELAHHLSGHPIQLGGTYPLYELEADKFSGYILYKMGAKRNDALKAVNALANDSATATLPSRDLRLKAVSEGWEFACIQQSHNCTGNEIPGAPLSTPLPSATPLAVKEETPTKMRNALTHAYQMLKNALPHKTPPPASSVQTAEGSVDILPDPDLNATPIKFGKFVVDEIGILDKATRLAFEKRMADLTSQHQLECATIVARDLHGMTADEYATLMLRQLRVGKLDLGNGAVFVVAPKEKQVGVALASQLSLELGDKIELEKSKLKSFMEFSLPFCAGTCKAEQSAMLFDAANHLFGNSTRLNATIKYTSPELLTQASKESVGTSVGNTSIDEQNSFLARIAGKVLNRQAQDETGKSTEAIATPLSPSLLNIQTTAGKKIQLVMPQGLEQLMPEQIQEGKPYVFVCRGTLASSRADHFELVSYAPVIEHKSAPKEDRK